MKRIFSTKCLAVTLALALLLSFAPAAQADSFYWAPILTKVTIYHAPDKNKSFETLDAGQKVKVEGQQVYQGTTWLRVWATNSDNSQQIGYMSPSAIPSNIPTSSFIGQATATASVNMYCAIDTGSTIMTTVPTGGEIKVIENYNNSWYFAQYNGVFYGYVSAASFSTLTTAAPATTAAPTTAVSSGSSSGVTTSINLLSNTVVSKGKLAPGTKLYKTNKLDDANAYGQVSNEGTCDVYYRVDNDFYMIGTGTGNSLYAYVPVQSVTVYDMSKGMPAYAGEVGVITVVNPNAPAAATAASTSKTATVTNCSKWVSMRAKAKSSASRVAKVPKGSSVTVLGTSGTYTKCSYDGKTGYILSTYVK